MSNETLQKAKSAGVLIYQYGCPILGIGETFVEAIRDAAAHREGFKAEYLSYELPTSENHCEIYWAHATEKLISQVSRTRKLPRSFPTSLPMMPGEQGWVACTCEERANYESSH
jgi:hypothetical protein